jgi:hypothetical protein
VLDIPLTGMEALKHLDGRVTRNQPTTSGFAIHPHTQIALTIGPVPGQVMPTQAHGLGALSNTGIEQEQSIVTDQGSHVSFHTTL